MKPKKSEIDPQGNLFYVRLEMICDPNHELSQLAARVDWSGLEDQFEPLYADKGAPGATIRMMSGLTMLQSLYGLSEDQVVDRWPENPYWQHL
ncbi:MAG: transposase, partial [Magnetococcales bacterium]|nr:transposase [Magnetococcales bacterium]